MEGKEKFDLPSPWCHYYLKVHILISCIFAVKLKPTQFWQHSQNLALQILL